MEHIQELINKMVKEAMEKRDKQINRIIKEAKKRIVWYREGYCYKCGGKVYSEESKGIWANFRCKECGEALYSDALYEYYYGPIIKQLELLK